MSKVAGNFIMESVDFPKTRKATPGQLLEIGRTSLSAIGQADLTFEQAEKIIKQPSLIYKFFREDVGSKKNDDNKNSRQIKAIWKKIYKDWFGLEKDFSNLQVQEDYDPKKHFAVIVSQGSLMNKTIVGMRKKFKVYVYTENLDKDVNQNDRTAEGGDYIVLFNRNIESDEEFKNFSANQLKTMNHKGITLMERLLLEVLYFNETKKHLDIDNITLCSGSRYDDGNVPRVDWDSDDDGLDVDWYDPGDSHVHLRSRVVVS